MKALYEQQAHRAAFFVAAHQDVVDPLTDIALELARVFIDRLASKVLPQNTISELQALLTARDPDRFWLWLRQHAVPFVRARASGAYWSLIDGMSSLTDATGAQWPYMTEVEREYRLKHALEHFGEFELYLEAEVTKISA